MCDAHGGIRGVDVLAARAQCSHGVSMRMSSGRTWMSTSTAWRSTAIVAAEVWMRPLRFGRRHALDAVNAHF